MLVKLSRPNFKTNVSHHFDLKVKLKKNILYNNSNYKLMLKGPLKILKLLKMFCCLNSLK